MNYKNTIFKRLKNNNGIITSKWIRENGIPNIYLSRLASENLITRVGRGIYIDESGDYDELFFLQYEKPKLIYSYTTALVLHEVIDLIPSILECTVESNYNVGSLPSNIRIHYDRKEIYETGIESVKTKYGNEVKVYSLEKTICDMVLNKGKVDSEVFGKSINNYIRSNKKNINELMKIAEKMNVKEKIQNIMELIYE